MVNMVKCFCIVCLDFSTDRLSLLNFLSAISMDDMKYEYNVKVLIATLTSMALILRKKNGLNSFHGQIEYVILLWLPMHQKFLDFKEQCGGLGRCRYPSLLTIS